MTPKNWQSLAISPKSIWECLRIGKLREVEVKRLWRTRELDPEALHKGIKKIKGRPSRKNEGEAGGIITYWKNKPPLAVTSK